MAFLALLSIAIAIVFNWRNSRAGCWLNLFTDVGFIAMLLIPAHSTDILGPILWILGLVFSTIGIRSASRTAKFDGQATCLNEAFEIASQGFSQVMACA